MERQWRLVAWWWRCSTSVSILAHVSSHLSHTVRILFIFLFIGLDSARPHMLISSMMIRLLICIICKSYFCKWVLGFLLCIWKVGAKLCSRMWTSVIKKKKKKARCFCQTMCQSILWRRSLMYVKSIWSSRSCADFKRGNKGAELRWCNYFDKHVSFEIVVPLLHLSHARLQIGH